MLYFSNYILQWCWYFKSNAECQLYKYFVSLYIWKHEIYEMYHKRKMLLIKLQMLSSKKGRRDYLQIVETVLVDDLGLLRIYLFPICDILWGYGGGGIRRKAHKHLTLHPLAQPAIYKSRYDSIMAFHHIPIYYLTLYWSTWKHSNLRLGKPSRKKGA